MKCLVALGWIASTLGIATVASAGDKADKAVCASTALKGQTHRDEHKLVEAREEFRACARAECPRAVRTDCATWLESLEQNLPTVVITAKNGAGAPLIDVTVKVDGQPLAEKLDGEAIPMNPGAHTFHFEGPGGTKVDEQIIVVEGQHNQAVAAVLGAPPRQEVGRSSSTEPSRGARPSVWRTVGWVTGGVGLAGLVLGATFGVMALEDKNDGHCVNNFCDHGPIASARTAATVSTAGFVAGGALLAGGVALVLFTGDKKREGSVSAALVPLAGPRDGGLALRGTW